MLKLLTKLTAPIAIFFVTLLLLLPQHAQAAEFRTGDQVNLTDTNQTLTDPYVFGGNIQIDSPINNELTVAGGDIVITSPIQGSALIAGGNITLRGSVGNNARIAGGNITIDGPITNDLVITGGTITLTRNASVGGDLLFAGGQLKADGPIAGDAMINGGDITVNNTIGGNVNGEMGKLVLGSGAVINGNLSYKSPERAQIAQGADVTGRTDYRPSEDKDRGNDTQEFLTTAALYKLIADIIISLLFIYFFKPALTNLMKRMSSSPVRSGAIGFGFFFLVPLAAFILMILIWLGLATLLFYFLTFIVALYILKVFLGWLIMRWWYRSQKREYELDWKAAIVGPLALFILSLIPVIGWLVAAVIFLIGLGAFVESLTQLTKDQHIHLQRKNKKLSYSF